MKVKARVSVFDYQKNVMQDFSSFSCLGAGYASGKSEIAFWKAMILNNYRRKQNIKSPVVAITAPSYRILKDSNIIDFAELLDRYNIKSKYQDKDKRFVLKGNHKGEFWFRTSDDPSSIVGFDATDAIYDEFDIPKKEKQDKTVIKMSARLRQNGVENPTQTFLSTTEGFKKMYEMFGSKNPFGKLYHARSYWNTFLSVSYVWNMLFRVYGKDVPKEIPYVLQTTYDQFKKEKTDKIKKKLLRLQLIKEYDIYYQLHYTPLLAQYVGGEFVNVNGLQAAYAFKKERDVINPIDTKDLPPLLYIGMDFNVSPFTATISFISKYEQHTNEVLEMTTFDERFIVNTGINPNMETWTHHMMESILKEYPTAYYKNKYKEDIQVKNKKTYRIIVCPDMSGMKGLGKRQTSAGRTDIQILQSYGCEVMGQFNPSVRDRLNATNQAFVNGKNKITSNCVKTIEDLDQVVTNQYGDLDKSDQMRCQIFDAHTYMLFRMFPVNYKKHKTRYTQ